MVIVDWKNTLSDLSRLIRTILTYLVFLALGFLLCYYYNEEKPISCSCNYTVTCDSPNVEVKAFVVKLPSTWPDSASYR